MSSDAELWALLVHIRTEEQKLLKRFAKNLWELEILRGMIAEILPDSPLADKVPEWTAICKELTRQFEVWTTEVRDRLERVEDALLHMPDKEH